MSGKKVAAFGIYSSRVAFENATDSLIKSGFPALDISVLLPESLGGPKDIGTEKATKAPEGTVVGVTTGGVIGGTLGLLAGVGLLAIPGPSPFIAAGPDWLGWALVEQWAELPALWLGWVFPNSKPSATKAA